MAGLRSVGVARAVAVIRYVVVTRDRHALPVTRFLTVEAAADYIVRERAFVRLTILAQEGNNLTASTPYRELTRAERAVFERKLYPSLFE